MEPITPGVDLEFKKIFGVDFTSIVGSGKYHSSFNIREIETNVPYFSDLDLHTIELNKFTNNPHEELSEILMKVKTSLDAWVTFLTRHELLKKTELPAEFTGTPLAKALDVMEVMNFTEEERSAYEDRLKWLRIEANTLKKVNDEAMARGMEKGMEQTTINMLNKGLTLT